MQLSIDQLRKINPGVSAATHHFNLTMNENNILKRIRPGSAMSELQGTVWPKAISTDHKSGFDAIFHSAAEESRLLIWALHVTKPEEAIHSETRESEGCYFIMLSKERK